MDIIFQDAGSAGSDLSVRHAELCEALTPGGDVVLHIAGVCAIDLGLLQLIEAGRRHAETIHCAFALSAPATGALDAALARAGFVTTREAADIGFWHHGESAQ